MNARIGKTKNVLNKLNSHSVSQLAYSMGNVPVKSLEESEILDKFPRNGIVPFKLLLSRCRNGKV